MLISTLYLKYNKFNQGYYIVELETRRIICNLSMEEENGTIL